MPKRRRLATGIFRDASGISVIVHEQGRPKEHRFPPNTPTDHLIAWRKRQVQQAASVAPREPRGSLARDVVTYLKRLKGLPGYKAEKSHLRAWLKRFQGWPRWKLTRRHVEEAIADWRAAGVAARTLRHRTRVLRALYLRLDGPRAGSPVDDVVLPLSLIHI